MAFPTIKYQHQQGYIKTPAFEDMMAKVKKREFELYKKLTGIEYQIPEGKISEIYNQTLEIIADKYKTFLEGTMKDAKELSDLIHLMIDRIHIYSRKATEKDVVDGRKKEVQMISNRIRIDLSLPQDMMIRLASEGKFEVKNREL